MALVQGIICHSSCSSIQGLVYCIDLFFGIKSSAFICWSLTTTHLACSFWSIVLGLTKYLEWVWSTTVMILHISIEAMTNVMNAT